MPTISMKTTNTTSPKVSKVTSTKKRGRPVGSKKMDKLNKINSKISKNTHELLALYPAKKYLERELPDSEATAEQVKDWGRFKSIHGIPEEPINSWKYACIAIILGIVAAMILSTPTIISLFDACVQ